MAFPIWRKDRRSPVPFHADLDTPLLQFGKKDRWTIRDACEGTQVFGGTGSGKTSGSGRSIAHSFLRAGMGGLVLCAKTSECAQWQKWAAETGREKSVIVIGGDGSRRFNFLDYAQATVGRDGFDHNLVEMFTHIAEAFAVNRQGGGGEGNSFFREYANEILSHSFPLLKQAYGTIRLAELMRLIDSAPRSGADLTDREWRQNSFCAQTLFRASQNLVPGTMTAHDIEQHGLFWTERYPYLGDRTRSSVVATLTATLSPFLVGRMHEIFCTDTNIVPDITHEGAIVVLDLPVKSYGKLGAVAQQIFKYLWQLSMERRADGKSERVMNRARPVFLWADECQSFMNSYDAEFLSTARSSRACSMFLSQDKPSYVANIDGGNVQAIADSLIGKFQTRIFHANTEKETCEYASEMIGKVKKYNVTRSLSSGDSTNDGGSQAEEGGTYGGGFGRTSAIQTGYSEYMDYDVPPDYFGNELRTGGPDNRYRVDAIMVRNGKTFRKGRRNRLKVEFAQR